MSDTIEKAEIKENFPNCNNCKNYISEERCSAFDFIPDLILSGENDHKKPLQGQGNKIVFEPLEDAAKK